jgi:hypothetical protein
MASTAESGRLASHWRQRDACSHAQLFREGAIMRSTYLILPASLLLLVTGVSAQTQSYPLTEPGAMSSVQVPAPAQEYAFWNDDAEAVSGGYAMSNGWRMKVEPSYNGVIAQIDKQRPIRLIAMSRDRYVSRDGNVSMQFNQGTRGDDVLMSYVPDTRTAQVVVVTATLAQR